MKPSIEIQSRLLTYIRQNIQLFEWQSTQYRDQMLNIYEALSTFEEPDTGSIQTRFKVNKLHEILRKVVPRIIAKAPRFVVTPRTDIFQDWDELKVKEERAEMLAKHWKMARATQDYLNILFEEDHFRERLKYWAIYMLCYWNAFAQIRSKFKIQRSKDKTWKVTEKMVWMSPTLDICSWTEMYYDARYKMLEDMPWLTRVKKRVRLQDIQFTKWLFNLDQVEKLWWVEFTWTDSYANQIFAITWISDIKVTQWIDKNAIELQESEIKFSLTWNPRDERLYKVTTVNSAILIWLEEITRFSYIDIKWHEDPEVFFSVWLLAPIMGLQDEINFQKNAYATSMGKNLNKSYWWAPESGVDPWNLLNDVPWNIIVCNNWVEQAQRNLIEVQDRPLESQYFANINDMNRDIQSLSHTTDVSQQWGQSALTNTATWARISFFESNSVIAELRKNFEKWVQELSYWILDWAVNNLEKDIILKKVNDNEFLKVNLEAIRNAVERYDITVEANSSAFDDLENRRADAIAVKNLLLEAANAGANVDIDEWFKKVFSTFEQLDVDKLMPTKQEEDWGLESLLWGSWANIPKGAEWAKWKPTTPAELTSAVAWWANLFQ